jgi:hypothetical protein
MEHHMLLTEKVQKLELGYMDVIGRVMILEK